LNQDSKFEQLYRRFYPSLLAFAIYLTGSTEDATELVNNVFVAVWQKRDNLPLDEKLKSYLFTAVKNQSINFHKRTKMTVVKLQPHDTESYYRADLPLEEKEMEHKLHSILNTLPSKCRQIFVMSRIDGLKNKEIAHFLDVSIKTVENQMTKALKIFKEKLNDA
jgi:RNA polymerase sigma-70 factor (ECF subfamily)